MARPGIKTPSTPKRVGIVGGGPGGLYLSILLKNANPRHEVRIVERNRPDDTFGFGVVFSDETLGHFRDHDAVSYDRITREFAYWGDIDMYLKGEVIRSGGHGFAGMERVRLLQLLQERAVELGVEMTFQKEVDPAAIETEFGDCDVIIAADGINSRIRERFADHFQPSVDLRLNMFAWMGSTRTVPAFTFAFEETKDGIWLLGAYQYKRGASTMVPECTQETWRSAGLDQASEAESAAFVKNVFKSYLGDAEMLINRSNWRRFPMIRNKRWHKDNIVLLGDALHTAHYSIGSGTKLAMEDAISLAYAIDEAPDATAAFRRFEEERRLDVEKTQYASEVSLVWFETPKRYWSLPPRQIAFSLLSRSKQITYENLKRRDPEFIDSVDRWFASDVAARQGVNLPVENPPPPMFTPFRLRGMDLVNRVVCSPMGMYSAKDGTPQDFHMVHLGSFALGGAGLVFTETTHASPEARITPGCCGIWNDEHTRAWARITDFVHDQSRAKICLQFGHAGRKGSTRRAWDGIDLPLPEGNWPITSASPLRFRPESQVPVEIDRAGMIKVRDDFVAAAKRAEQAGFDMIELHCGHGYLLSSFLSPLTNQRTDGYGGSVENRMKFPLEVFSALREAWPDKPLSVRISAVDWFPGGNTIEDALIIAKGFKDAGADLIDVSTGQVVHEQKPVYGRMYQTQFADAVRNELDIAAMAVGAITSPDQVNTIVLSGRADLVAIARLHMTNPHFTLHASAHYGFEAQHWPNQYLSGRDQAMTLWMRDNQDLEALRAAARPPSHWPEDQRLDRMG